MWNSYLNVVYWVEYYFVYSWFYVLLLIVRSKESFFLLVIVVYKVYIFDGLFYLLIFVKMINEYNVWWEINNIGWLEYIWVWLSREVLVGGWWYKYLCLYCFLSWFYIFFLVYFGWDLSVNYVVLEFGLFGDYLLMCYLKSSLLSC